MKNVNDEAQGQRVVPLESLRPWGKAVTIARERPEDVLALLETGATAESRVENTYPQLIWEQEGPLAPNEATARPSELPWSISRPGPRPL